MLAKDDIKEWARKLIRELSLQLLRGHTKFLEFFAARIRNLNTREADARACAQFLAWSEQHLDDIRLITPMHVAAYIEHHPGSPQTIKRHLAAIKMLFDYLVVSQIVPVNPAAPVKGPTHVVKRGKTLGLER